MQTTIATATRNGEEHLTIIVEGDHDTSFIHIVEKNGVMSVVQRTKSELETERAQSDETPVREVNDYREPPVLRLVDENFSPTTV